jgi:hypothetical protein
MAARDGEGKRIQKVRTRRPEDAGAGPAAGVSPTGNGAREGNGARNDSVVDGARGNADEAGATAVGEEGAEVDEGNATASLATAEGGSDGMIEGIALVGARSPMESVATEDAGERGAEAAPDRTRWTAATTTIAAAITTSAAHGRRSAPSARALVRDHSGFVPSPVSTRSLGAARTGAPGGSESRRTGGAETGAPEADGAGVA